MRRVEVSVDDGPWQPAEGTEHWLAVLDTTKLVDGHHVLRVRAIDVASQATLAMPLRLHLVENNAPARGEVLVFQQGRDGYVGCSAVTVRRHNDPKSLLVADGEMDDLENWTWNFGAVEYSEFYIRFDLAQAGIPRSAKVKQARLVLFASRQNGVKDTDTERGRYALAVLKQPWKADMTFATRPAQPGLAGYPADRARPRSEGHLAVPRRAAARLAADGRDGGPDADQGGHRSVDRGPAVQSGAAVGPIRAELQLLGQKGPACLIATLRPRLEVEIEKP